MKTRRRCATVAFDRPGSLAGRPRQQTISTTNQDNQSDWGEHRSAVYWLSLSAVNHFNCCGQLQAISCALYQLYKGWRQQSLLLLRATFDTYSRKSAYRPRLLFTTAEERKIDCPLKASYVDISFQIEYFRWVKWVKKGVFKNTTCWWHNISVRTVLTAVAMVTEVYYLKTYNLGIVFIVEIVVYGNGKCIGNQKNNTVSNIE